MVRLASTQSDNSTEQANLASVSRLVEPSGIKEFQVNLAYSLMQSNLDLETTLERFYSSVQDFVQTSGMTFSNKSEGIDVSLGRNCAHTAAYSIDINGNNLGQLIFSRNKRFAETELAVLEMLIGVLYLPLRNALLYRDALEASMRDKLTGIGNRSALEVSFEREIKLATRHKQALSVLMLDVDHFKGVNDSVGHLSADLALKQMVKSIQHTLRETDQVFRYGGEEFVVLLHNSSAHEARVIAERIRLNVAMSPVALDNQDLFCTVSIGAASFCGVETAEELLERADSALYHAKNTGRNKVESWSNMSVTS
ncbi:MAG: GGDEF domain-containing protein [Agarilytica sp.]